MDLAAHLPALPPLSPTPCFPLPSAHKPTALAAYQTPYLPLGGIWGIGVKGGRSRRTGERPDPCLLLGAQASGTVPPSPMHNSPRSMGDRLKSCAPQKIKVSRIDTWCRTTEINPFTSQNECSSAPGSTIPLCRTPPLAAHQSSVMGGSPAVCSGCVCFLWNPSFGQKPASLKSHPFCPPRCTENMCSVCARTRAHEPGLLIWQTPINAPEIASPAYNPTSLNSGTENRPPASSTALSIRVEHPLPLDARFCPRFTAALAETRLS